MKRKTKRIIAGLMAIMLACAPVMGIVSEAKGTKTDEITIDDISTDMYDFIKIKGKIYYDPATNIVWMKYTTYGWLDGITPYVSPDGLPYKYDPDTKTFHTITSEKEAAAEQETAL